MCIVSCIGLRSGRVGAREHASPGHTVQQQLKDTSATQQQGSGQRSPEARQQPSSMATGRPAALASGLLQVHSFFTPTQNTSYTSSPTSISPATLKLRTPTCRGGRGGGGEGGGRACGSTCVGQHEHGPLVQVVHNRHQKRPHQPPLSIM